MAQELNLDQLAEAMRNQRHPCLRWDPTVYDRPSIHPLSIDFCNLMLAIEKYNNEIRQGWSLNEEIKFDEELLRNAIEEYNNSVVRKYGR